MTTAQSLYASNTSVSSGISQAVKLVISDLDDTFWQGTLSEGGVTLDETNAELVRTLAARGIVSSICSRNEFGPFEK